MTLSYQRDRRTLRSLICLCTMVFHASSWRISHHILARDLFNLKGSRPPRKYHLGCYCVTSLAPIWWIVFPPSILGYLFMRMSTPVPKFGITLFDWNQTRVINDLDDLSGVAKPSHNLLHIPTPWHNCVSNHGNWLYLCQQVQRDSRCIEARPHSRLLVSREHDLCFWWVFPG